MRRIILSAISSGSGKTTLTCGLLKELKDRGLLVNSYKCGPDYIDPMFHKKVLGIPSENLDLFFSDEEHVNKILYRNREVDISVIEGAMGIYDGILGKGNEGSVYDLAVKTGTPIVLIVDAHGMGNTLISVIKGIKIDDKKDLIKGIILNRLSEHFYKSIYPLIEEQTGIKVLGFVGKLKDISIDSRHLGLKLPDEINDLSVQIESVRSEISKTIDIDGLISIAEGAKEIESASNRVNDKRNEDDSLNMAAGYIKNKPRLAVAYDEAFCFYYEENFRVLKDAGVELAFFSPIHDKQLPNDISGILIGGGYPELKLNELEANESMRDSIKNALEKGMPSLAECGGFMYLHDTISNDSESYNMVGAVSGNCFNTGKLCRFGYVNVSIADYIIKGHEFHYYDSTNNGADGKAVKPEGKRQWEFGHYSKGRLWGFPHLYYGSCVKLIDEFVDAMKEYQENNLNG